MNQLENTWKEIENIDYDTLDKEIIETMNKYLKKTVWKKEENKKVYKPWFKEYLKKEISKRRILNKERRKSNNETEKKILTEIYLEQKIRVKEMIEKEIAIYENKITEEIKQDKTGRNLYKNIKKLTKEKIESDEIQIYDNEGKIIPKESEMKVITEFWKSIQSKEENKISQVWNETIKENLLKEYEERIIQAKQKKSIREHMDMYINTEEIIIPMQWENIKENEVKTNIKKLKDNKASGPDNIKPEYIKILEKCQNGIEIFTKCFNEITCTGNVPEKWKGSKTKLIPKCKKPKVKDFRPIAITNIQYKLYLAIIKDRIEKHIIDNNLRKENQMGFTKGYRIEYNHLLLQYLIEGDNNKKPLIIIAIDYTKAFDSIKREEMINGLIEYEIHPYIIDIFAKLYNNDYTNIEYKDKTEKITISNGIRQGCTASSVLFKIITYIIMSKLEREGRPYYIENLNINQSFFADDSIFAAESIKDAEKNLEIIIDISRKFGLNINKDKSNILIYRNSEMRKEIKEIAGIKVTNTIKYLGLEIYNTKNLFKIQKEKAYEKALKFANRTYSIIAKSSNRVLIGKTYWKNIALPSILNGAEIIDYSETDIKKLQTIENSVYKKIFGANSSTPEEVLRGELGSSNMRSRIMKTKLIFVKKTLETENELIKNVMINMLEKENNRWVNEVSKYLDELGLRLEDLELLSVNKIKDTIREYDTNTWKQNMQNKSSLQYYREWKNKIENPNIYKNDYQSKIIFQARTNQLPLNDRQEDKSCKICITENEDIIHLLYKCNGYKNIREKYQIIKQEEDFINGYKQLCFSVKNVNIAKKYINEVWVKRKKLLKEKEIAEYNLKVKELKTLIRNTNKPFKNAAHLVKELNELKKPQGI